MFSKSSRQLQHIERVSRRTRHHQIYLNQKYDEKLDRNLTNLTNEFEQTRLRLKANEKLEKQRKEVLDITVAHISNEQKLPKIKTKTNNKILNSRPSSPFKLPPVENSCHLFSKKCQLYPCQPVYEYTSFITKDHDKTLRERNPSHDKSPSTESSNLQELMTKIQETKSQADRRQLASAINNQYRLANRHNYITRTKANLDEQSRLLQEQLADKRKVGFDKDYRDNLKPAIQRHLRISAKFCA